MPHLNPAVARNFVLADIDARENRGAHFPGRFLATVLGPYVRFATAANGVCSIGLVADFGGYFHFLLEILPLILVIGRKREVQAVVSPAVIDRYPFVQAALAEAGIVCRIATMPEGGDARVVDLVSCSRLAYYYPNLASVRILRDTFTPKRDAGDPRRLFLSRRADANTNGRVIVNESEMLARLADLGFVAFHAEDYTFKQQQRIFSGAEIVVGVSGAGLSNTVFMESGSMVVELKATLEFGWQFALLAKHCGLRYSMLEVELLQVINHRPMWLKVDVERLASLIEDGLRQSSDIRRLDGAAYL